MWEAIRTSRVGSTEVLISVRDLYVHFVKGGILSKRLVTKAVDGVSLHIGRGEVLGLVGESGSGKTTLGRVTIGLQRPTRGEVIYHRRSNGLSQDLNLYSLRGREQRLIRREMQMIFQDPYSSVDPIIKVYDAMRLPLRYMGVKEREEANRRIEEAFNQVGLPFSLVNNYVFQLSGGQRQRLSIARALLFNPRYIVADEPVSMVDASLKGEIINIMQRIRQNMGTSFLFITHEMAIARAFADRIAVMYLGKIVEIGSTDDVISHPLHPYTQLLIQASPRVDPALRDKEVKLQVKDGISSSVEIPRGCRYAPRCPFAMEVCRRDEPPLKEVQPGHQVSCWLY